MTNQVTGEFAGRSDTLRYLFNKGTNVIMQQLSYQKSSTTPTYKTHTTPQFRIIDTVTGKTIKQVRLSKDYGEAKKLICKDTKPTLILTEKNTIHLFDIETMTIKKSKNLPFKQFFVL